MKKKGENMIEIRMKSLDFFKRARKQKFFSDFLTGQPIF